MKTGLHVDQPARYRIKVQGRLDPRWAKWFPTCTFRVTRSAGKTPTTTFTGEVADQAALHGWLSQLRDLGLPLLLVQYLGEISTGINQEASSVLNQELERKEGS